MKLIVAMNLNKVIGRNNQLPWHIPEDLKRFKELTLDQNIVMGRKTFESLPFVLPRRNHYVLTRELEHKTDYYPEKRSTVTFLDLDTLKHKPFDWKNSWCIGGAEIYKLLAPYVDHFYLTLVEEESLEDGDIIFPFNSFSHFKMVKIESHESKKNNLKFKFIEYRSRVIDNRKTI